MKKRSAIGLNLVLAFLLLPISETAEAKPKFLQRLLKPFTSHQTPVAQVTSPQIAFTGQNLNLSGAASSDPNGDSLEYTWAITSLPAGSQAQLAETKLVETALSPDAPGPYIVSLIVSDGTNTSRPAYTIVNAFESGGEVVFGPESFQGIPTCLLSATPFSCFPETRTFTTLNPNRDFSLEAQNLGVDQGFAQINGVEILGGLDFTGPNSFTRRSIGQLAANNTLIVDTRGSTGSTMSITIRANELTGTENKIPAPTADPLIAAQNIPGSTTVLPNDPDTTDTHFFQIVIPPIHGIASIDSFGFISYSPETDYTGADNLTVLLTDSGSPQLSALIKVDIQVTGNRIPQPSANSITAFGTPGGTQIFPNDPDEGQTHTYTVTRQPAFGSATVDASGFVTYSPSVTTGTTDLEVRVTDNGSPQLSAFITIPVIANASNPPQVQQPNGITVKTGQTGTSQIVATDPDAGQTISYTIETAPAFGSASVNTSGLVTFTANATSGTTAIGVRVTDDAISPASTVVSVPVTVIANTAPTGTAPAINVNAGATATSQITVQDSDTEQTHTFAIPTQPAGGTATVSATGLVSFTADGTVGSTSISVTITDTGLPQLSGTVVIPVTVVLNNAPSISAPSITSHGQIATSQATATDPDASQTLTLSISQAPAFGTAAISAAGLVTYTPDGTIGSTSIGVTVTDNGIPNKSASVNIPVTVNANTAPAPTANPASLNASVNTVFTIAISANDADPNQGHSYQIITAPTLGAATVSPTGVVTYTAGSVQGTDSLTVRVIDNAVQPLFGDVTVPISISNNLPPQVGDILFVRLSESVPISARFNLINAFDPDGTITEVRWNFGDGSPEIPGGLAPFFNRPHQYVAQGTYTVTAKVKDNFGAVTTFSKQINVVDGPRPRNRYKVTPLSGPAPLAINFDASGSTAAAGITSYRWVWGDGSPEQVTATQPIVSHTFNVPGTYNVRFRLRDTTFGESDHIVSVYAGVSTPPFGFLPFPDFEALPREQIVGQNITLDGSRSYHPEVGEEIASYQFLVNDPGTCAGQPNEDCAYNPVDGIAQHTVGTAENFFASLLVTNDQNGASNRVFLEMFGVNQGHAPRILRQILTSNNNQFFGVVPFFVSINASVSFDYDGTISNYEIDFDDNAIVNSSTATHTYTTPGVYVSRISVTDNHANTVHQFNTFSVNSSTGSARWRKKVLDVDPPADHEREVLTNACGMGSGEACYMLAKSYELEGDTFTAGHLYARACELGYQQACSLQAPLSYEQLTKLKASIARFRGGRK